MSTSAISATRKSAKELADGTLRVSLDIDPRFKRDFHRLFPEIDMPVAIVPLEHDFEQREQADSQYGEHAKALRLSGFFRAPEVWKAIGTDAEYLEWLKTQKCCCANPSAGPCYGDIVAAHVRRVANGAGTAIKPPYSAISLCDKHHRLQGDKGESAVGGREYFEQQRIKHLEKWAWETLKAIFGFESWKDVPPKSLRYWALGNNVVHYLPNIYKEIGEKD